MGGPSSPHPFPAISDYGFLSDCRSSALVAADGSVEWLCWPRFDSPSIFARILDRERGGHFTIRPTGEYRARRQYLSDSNVLRTTFEAPGGTVEIDDWLHTGSRQALCRLIAGVRGEVELEAICDARPGYGRGAPPAWQSRFGFLVAELEDGHELFLDGFDAAWTGEAVPGAPTQRFIVSSGEHRGFCLGFERPGPTDLFSASRRALEFWNRWASSLRLPAGPHKEAVLRSALVLKGLQYAPTGAIVAAATTSLPEVIGGERNFDYRFSWLRDAAFTLHALDLLGRRDEAESYFDWLRLIAVRSGAEDLQILYGVGGEAKLPEAELDHLGGYRGSRPVRIGNAAAKQTQHDTLGELADAIWLHHRRDRRPLNPHRWLLVRSLARRAAADWRTPDEGMWEVRGRPRHFVSSKVMCWVALDRALRLARSAPHQLVDREETAHWEREREAIHAEVLERGYDERIGAFTQSYGSESLDASNLLMARLGFISPSDERFRSTVMRTRERLMRNGLLLRYDHGSDDGFAGEEGTFTICTLWLVLALLEIGETDEAREIFERVLSHSSDLGLFSEELAPDGEQLGNYPQAFTHIALIVCAFALERAQAYPLHAQALQAVAEAEAR